MCERVMVMLLAAATISSLLLPEIRAMESPEFTREQEFRTRDGALVVQSGSVAGGMFIVSVNNRTIDVTPTSSSAKPCKGMAIDPFEDVLEGEVRAILLESDSVKTMVIWGAGRSELISANSSRVVGYTMLLVNLETCASRALLLPDDQIHSSQPILLPEVQIGFQGYLDVYFASRQYCSPCAFDRYGHRLRSPQLEAEDAEPAGNFHLRPLYPVEGSFGYFYAFNFMIGNSVVKLLTSDYQAQRVRRLNHPVDVVSVKIGRIRNVGYCYQSPNELRCERLDSRLRSVAPVLVPLDQPARKVSLEYDEQGNSFVAVVLAEEARVFVYSVFGELIATLDFGPFQVVGEVRHLRAYIDANQYCLFYSIQHASSNDASNIVKCIDRTRYIEYNYL